MTLAAGFRLGPYEVIAPLGSGGMGEVYRARDPKLKRDVAVKVLPESLAQDADALARFEREAHAVGALNHPNILSIHDFGTHDGIAYAVTELLEGEPLRDLLAEGPLPPRRVVGLSGQICAGLAAAHANGIVHRDLKPDNLFVTEDGRVKILDFGLAKRAARPFRVEDTSSPTASAFTEPGTVMGTVGYMSPEQVKAQPVDHRSDIFSFGAVLYEMLTGKRAFHRETAAETMTAVLREEPPEPSEAGRRIPPPLDRIVRHCLEKKPDQRFQSASDVAFALDEALDASLSAGAAGHAAPPPRGKRAAAVIAVVAAAAAVTVWMSVTRRPAAVPDSEDVSVSALTTDAGYEGEPTLSPDGQTLAYVSDRSGNSEIYFQQISGGPAINLTQNPAEDIQPSFSPDGRQIAFVSNRSGGSDIFFAAPQLPLVGGDIWVMPALGGSARRIVEGGNFPSWSPDGTTIVYAHGPFRNCRIATVPAAGGASRDLPIQESALAYFSPSFSPDGRWLIYRNGSTIEVVSAGGGMPRALLTGEYPAWGARGDEIVFTNDAPGKNRTLSRVRFENGRLAGLPRPLTFGRGADLGAKVSRDGRSIVYSAVDETLNLEKMPFDAGSGRPTGPPVELTRGSNRISFFSPSPDGASVVFGASFGEGSHLWRIDPPAMPVQLTLDPRFSEDSPSWSPDGREIAFERRGATDDPAAGGDLWIMTADGAAPRRVADVFAPYSWMPDGRRLLALQGDGVVLVDVTSGKARAIAGTTTRTNFSVDRAGEWIAFQTAGNGNADIAAVPAAGGSPRIVVASPQEDNHPFFSPSGRWLFFLPDHKNLYRIPGPEQAWRPAPQERVTDFPPAGLYLEDPKIARDGKTLFFTRGRRTGDIYVLRFAATTRSGNPQGRMGADTPTTPDVSPGVSPSR